MSNTKIIVLGKDRSGRTRFCTKVTNSSITEVYGYTMGVSVYQAYTPEGVADLWEIGRDGMRRAYFTKSKGAIIIYDTDETKEMFKKEVRDECGKIPIVYIESKTISTMKQAEANHKVEEILQKLKTLKKKSK